MSTTWYYAAPDDEQQAFDEDQFSELINSGHLRPDTLIWTEGLEAWSACGELYPHLFEEESESESDSESEPDGGGRPRLILPSQGTGPALAMGGAASAALGGAPKTAGTLDVTTLLEDQEKRLVRESAGKISKAGGWMTLLGCLTMLSGLPSGLVGVGCLFAGFQDTSAIVPALSIGGLFIAVAVLLIWLGTRLMKGASEAAQAVRSGYKPALDQSLEAISKYFMTLGIIVLLYLCAGALIFIFSAVIMSKLDPNEMGGEGRILEQMEMPE